MFGYPRWKKRLSGMLVGLLGVHYRDSFLPASASQGTTGMLVRDSSSLGD